MKLAFSKTPKTGFLATRPNFILILFTCNDPCITHCYADVAKFRNIFGQKLLIESIAHQPENE